MKRETVECYCDYCNKEVSHYSYENFATFVLTLDLPNPKGGCGNFTGIRMKICDECCEELGLVNDKEYHDYTYSESKLKRFVKDKKVKIIDFLTRQ